MSNSTQSSDSTMDISDIQNSIIDTQIITATTAWVCYEWLVTLDQEIKHIWAQPWTLSTWIFVASRYATIIMAIIQVTPIWSYVSCVWEFRLEDVCLLLQLLALALFTALRTYALRDRRIWIFLIVFTLSIAPFVVNLENFINSPIIISSDLSTCQQELSWTGTVQLGISLATRGSVIIADIIALVISWRCALGSVREASRLRMQVPLSRVLVEDGTVLFLGLLAVNVYEMLADNITYLREANIGDQVMIILPSILMCRFMLNLKQAGHIPGPNSTVGQQSSVNFNSFLANSNILVGNLGESLNLGDEDDEQAGDDSGIQATYTHRDVSGEYDNNGEGSAGAIEGQGDQTFFEHEGGISHDVAEESQATVSA